MNTALIVEPRALKRIPLIINHFQSILGDTWKIVFYCGKGLKEKWVSSLSSTVEIRELDTNNLSGDQYSDLLKTRSLWESLYGDFVLVFQTDAWIMNKKPYTIDYFVGRNKSYIGGNMCYKWYGLKFRTPFSNFNGGLSLRKRQDMIAIIEKFPPTKTELDIQDEAVYNSTHHPVEASPEDLYFVSGCYSMNLPLGDTDEEFNHFALHTIYYPDAFGVHKPSPYVKNKVIREYPEIQTAYMPPNNYDPAE